MNIRATKYGGNQYWINLLWHVKSPLLDDISPDSDWLSGNAFITIYGHKFTYVTNVSFGSQPAQYFVIQSDNVIVTSDFPTSTPGLVEISVTNAEGTTVYGFEFIENQVPLTLTNYSLAGSNSYGICTGPDGNLWVADYNGYVWQVTTAGVGTQFALAGSAPYGICTGPDGNLWVADYNGYVWQVTTAGVGTRYSLPGGSRPYSICAGPDGNLWVADYSGYIWKVTTVGAAAKHIITNTPNLMGITTGPDGNLWSIDTDGNIWENVPPPGAIGTASGYANVSGTQNSQATGTAHGVSTAVGQIPPNFYLSGDTFIQITGSGFTGASSVDFGGVPASWFNVVNDSLINTAVFPVASPQSVNLSVNSTVIESVNFVSKTINGTGTNYRLSDTYYFLDLCTGTDGNMWAIKLFNQSTQVYLAKISTSGTVLATFSLPSGTDGAAQGLCVGPDGNFWIPEANGNNGYVLKVSPTGSILNNYPLTGSNPGGICVGPDGNLWVTDFNGAVWKVTTSGTATNYSSGGFNSIVSGPDGNLWASGYISGTPYAVKITTSGSYTPYALSGAAPYEICVGPDGNLWVVDATGAVWKVTTSGSTTKYSLGGDNRSICAGPDGNLWVTNFTNRTIYKVTTSGAVTSHTLSAGSVYLENIIVGPDGNLWIVCFQQFNTDPNFIKVT